jgi:hypothetical protein
MWPLCRAVSSIRWKSTHRSVTGSSRQDSVPRDRVSRSSGATSRLSWPQLARYSASSRVRGTFSPRRISASGSSSVVGVGSSSPNRMTRIQ